jgi:hypothetical protein
MAYLIKNVFSMWEHTAETQDRLTDYFLRVNEHQPAANHADSTNKPLKNEKSHRAAGPRVAFRLKPEGHSFCLERPFVAIDCTEGAQRFKPFVVCAPGNF